MTDIQVREPTDSEIEFFRKSSHIPAYAAPDDAIVFNPFVNLTAQQRKGMILNEGARIYMRQNKIDPEFDISPAQKLAPWAQEYYSKGGGDKDVKASIVGRLLSGDASVGEASPEQIDWARTFGQKFGKIKLPK